MVSNNGSGDMRDNHPMRYRGGIDGQRRLLSAAGVVALHALIALMLLAAPDRRPVVRQTPALTTFDVEEPEEPVVIEAPREVGGEGAAASPAPAPAAASVAAPVPSIDVVSPVVAAPAIATGAEPAAGGASTPGPGSGSGGVGDGMGSGEGGDGRGGGGGVRSERIAGTIADRDYPRRARRRRAEGSVKARFTIGTDGRARDCTVVGSSGDSDLDSATCRLIERRFRYRPARDAAGAAVIEERGWRQDWWLERW